MSIAARSSFAGPTLCCGGHSGTALAWDGSALVVMWIGRKRESAVLPLIGRWVGLLLRITSYRLMIGARKPSNCISKVERHWKMTDSEDPQNTISPGTVAVAYQAAHGSSTGARVLAVGQLEAMFYLNTEPPAGSNWEDQSLFGLLLYHWLMKGHETYYLSGVKYSYIRHYFSMPIKSIGGFIQAPLYGPWAGDPTLSWLRLADFSQPVGVNGSVIQLTSTWLGGPGGHWDSTLYVQAA